MRQSRKAVLAIVFTIVLSIGSAVGQADTSRKPAFGSAIGTTTIAPTTPVHPAVKTTGAHRRQRRKHAEWVRHIHGRIVIDPVALGRHLNNLKFGAKYWSSLYKLWYKESKWNPWERYGDACGIPQALPCSKIPNPSSIASQIKWGLNYIKERYGNPAIALREWIVRQQTTGAGWY